MLDIDSTYQQEAQRLSNITFEPLSDSELSPTMEQQALNTLAKESLKNLNVEEVFTRTQLQSSNNYIAVESYLTDSAEKWFRANKSTIPDWSLFKIELVKAYKPSLHQLL
ncbi:unnamed protein product, partial [Adineta steineri]